METLNQISTPYYYYNIEILRSTLDTLVYASQKYDYHVHYAMKANVNKRILGEIKKFGLGADCVSGNEIRAAIESDFDANSIVFAGVGKTDQEIEYAIENNIYAFQCESLQELEVIDELASRLNKHVNIALRINPYVDAETHEYITTGTQENKFGIHFSDLDVVINRLESLSNIHFIGLHFHIGSQITNLEVFENLCQQVNVIQDWFLERDISIQYLNLGGGLGVNYHEPDEDLIPDFESFFETINKHLNVSEKTEVHFELGRSIVAQCGELITSVLYSKEGLHKDFLIVDAGMTELLRPALYNAYHKVERLISTDELTKAYDVVGPICESSDTFGKGIELPESKRGDKLRIRTAGAYGQIMSLSYNLRSPIEIVYSDEIL